MGVEGIVIEAAIGTAGFKKGTKEIKDAVKGLSNSAKKFGTQMTGIIRRLVPMIIGVGSAYAVISKGVSSFMAENEMLSARMSAIWTAIGNLLGPIITQIIDWVSTAVSYFISFLNLLGVTNKTASELSKKAKKNASDLQRTIAGFDELNVLQEPQKENPLETLEPKEWMGEIAELIKSGLWREAGKKLAEKLNELIAKVDWHALGLKVRDFFMKALDFLMGAVEGFDWQALGTAIHDFITGLFDNPEEIIQKIKEFLGIIWNAALDFLKGLFWGDVEEDPPLIKALRDLGDKLSNLFDKLLPILERLWNEWLKPMIDDLVENKLPGIVEKLGTIVDKVSEFIEKHPDEALEIVKGIIELIIGLKVAKKVKNVIDKVGGLIDLLSGGGKKTLAGAAKAAADAVGGAGGASAGSGGLVGALSTLGTMLGVGGAAGLGVGLGMVIAHFAEIPLEAYQAERGAKLLTETLEGTSGTVMDLAEAMNGFKATADQYDTVLNESIVGLDSTGLSLQQCEDASRAYQEALAIMAQALGLTTDELKKQIEAANGDVTQIEALNSAVSQTGDAMVEGAENINKGAQEYKEATDKVAESATNAAEVAEEATEKIETVTSENTETAATNATDNAETMEEKTVDSFETMNEDSVEETEEMRDDIADAFEQMKESAIDELEDMYSESNSIFTRLSGDAYIWGSDLMTNFINGIRSLIPTLQSDMYAIAEMVDSYIGFSKPDKGPLADFDKSGPDMMELFAEGMRGGAGSLVSALNDIADTVSVRAPGVAGGALLPYGVAAASGASDSGSFVEDPNVRLIEAINSLETSIRNGNWVIDFGNFRLVAKEITKVQRQMARAEGA